MSGISKRVSGSWVSGDYGIMGTSTGAITTFPAIIYPNDTTATVGLKGNMSQTGTPTPQNPIQPSECGERTNNLFDYQAGTPTAYKYLDENGNEVVVTESSPWYITDYIPIPDGVLSVTLSKIGGGLPAMCAYDVSKNYITGIKYNTGSAVTKVDITLTSSTPIRFIRFSYFLGNTGYDDISTKMLNTGSTPLPYEPYGIKIPISSASTTTPVYLGEVESTRYIKKIVFDGTETGWNIAFGVFYNETLSQDYLRAQGEVTILCSHYPAYRQVSGAGSVPSGSCSFYYKTDYQRLYINDSNYSTIADFKSYLAQQYSNGTPVTIWYVIAEPTIGIVNEPIRKIGDYADAISGITIHTTAGENALDVLTTLKSSEVTVNYKGWHPVADVHEKSKNLFDYSTVTIGKYISASGEEETSSGTGEQSLNHSDYITVNAGMTYTFKCDKSLIESATFNSFCWFDSNKQFIKRATFDVGAVDPYILGTATAPTGTAYLIMNYRGLHGDTAMLNEGSTALPYESYWE